VPAVALQAWFFRPADQVEWLIGEWLVPKGPWPWTDDTAMALSVYQVLTEHGEIRQDQLARLFPAQWWEAAEPLPSWTAQEPA
jgi:ADP-ribosylglycohydrolase